MSNPSVRITDIEPSSTSTADIDRAYAARQIRLALAALSTVGNYITGAVLSAEIEHSDLSRVQEAVQIINTDLSALLADIQPR